MFRLALALVALVPLCAADILTVGPAGSGAQFSQIQAAVDAAHDDDVILVQPGDYQDVVVDKPLRILGDAGSVGVGVVTVRDIGAGKELVLSGVYLFLVLLQNCPGTVVLQDIDAQTPASNAVQVENCARAVLLDSLVIGGVLAQNSTLWIANADITGGRTSPFGGNGTPGVQVTNSVLHVWRTSVRGGDNRSKICFGVSVDGGPGILAVGSTVNLFGGPSSLVAGGWGGSTGSDLGCSPDPGGPGMKLTVNSHARIQAAIPIQGGFSGGSSSGVQAPAIVVDGTSSATLDAKVFPTLVSSARRVQLGSSFTLTLEGNPGSYQVLRQSLRTGPTSTFPGVDGFGLLDRANLVWITSEVLPPSGTFAFTFGVPSTMSLLGATLFFQAVAVQVGATSSGATAQRFPNGSVVPGPVTVNRSAIGNPVLVPITP
jgi:hypothetical protein